MINFQTATTISCAKLAANYHLFKFQTDNPQFTFIPGQYITLKVADVRINHYSIASAPDSNTFELLIDSTPGGPGSQYAKKLQVGDVVEYLGPFGNFTLHAHDAAEELFFLATGSGIAPFKSMIDFLLINSQDSRKIYLFFGLRYEDQIIFHDHFTQLESHYPNFKFQVCISQPNQTWQGVSGYVTHAAEKQIFGGAKVAAYLCGSQQMINDATAILTHLKVPTNRIYTEKFW